MRNIDLSARAEKFFKSRDKKQKKQISQKIASLSEDAFPNDSKALIGFSDYRRVDIGEYRIIYEVSGSDVLVIVIGKRNDGEVYRKFKRLF